MRVHGFLFLNTYIICIFPTLAMPQCVSCLRYKHGSAFYTYKLACGSLRFRAKCKDCSVAIRRYRRHQQLFTERDRVSLDDFKGVARRQLAYRLRHQREKTLSEKYGVSPSTIHCWKEQLADDSGAETVIIDSDVD